MVDNDNDDEIVIDENSEIYKAAQLAWEEAQEEIAEMMAFEESIDELYEEYKQNLDKPEFQEYQKDVIQKATQLPNDTNRNSN